eukprot:2106370-Pleurochrysis_carterae.AAC.1
MNVALMVLGVSKDTRASASGYCACILNMYTVGNRRCYRYWPGNVKRGLVGAMCLPAYSCYHSAYVIFRTCVLELP